jgi:hypothetical protein
MNDTNIYTVLLQIIFYILLPYCTIVFNTFTVLYFQTISTDILHLLYPYIFLQYMYIFIVIDISNLIKVVINRFFMSRSSDLMMAVLIYPKHVALSLMDIQYVVVT